MAVVICPGAVRAQIDEKDRQLDALGKAVGEAYNKIDGFCNAGAQNKEMWNGEAFQAACAHMELYRNFCKALGECIEKTKAADQKVKDALGSRFGDASYINEQEWLDRQAYAQDRVNSLRQQAVEVEQEGDSWGFGAGFLAAVLRFSADGWRRSANYAGEMLSKIRSYCEETDYLHEGLSGWLHETRVDAAIISNCSVSFSRGGLWREDLGSFYGVTPKARL